MQSREKTAMLVPKQLKNVAQVLRNNRVKFLKGFFAIVLPTNMAVVTSDAIKELCKVAIEKKKTAVINSFGFPRIFS